MPDTLNPERYWIPFSEREAQMAACLGCRDGGACFVVSGCLACGALVQASRGIREPAPLMHAADVQRIDDLLGEAAPAPAPDAGQSAEFMDLLWRIESPLREAKHAYEEVREMLDRHTPRVTVADLADIDFTGDQDHADFVAELRDEDESAPAPAEALDESRYRYACKETMDHVGLKEDETLLAPTVKKLLEHLRCVQEEKVRLRRALRFMSPRCENLNHEKRDQHAEGPCPVEERVKALLRPGAAGDKEESK